MNWHERIDAAEARGGFDQEDRRLARSWVTCACGEQDPKIPRGSMGDPLDSRLFELGDEFSRLVASDHFSGARLYLARIERRASEILAELPGMTDRTQIRVVTTGLALFLVAAWVTYVVGFFTGDGFGVALPLYVKVFYGILLALISIVFLDAMVPRKRERVR